MDAPSPRSFSSMQGSSFDSLTSDSSSHLSDSDVNETLVLTLCVRPYMFHVHMLCQFATSGRVFKNLILRGQLVSLCASRRFSWVLLFLGPQEWQALLVAAATVRLRLQRFFCLSQADSWSHVDVTRSEVAWYQEVAGGGSSAPMHPAVVQALFEAVFGRSGGCGFAFPFQLPLLGRADMFAEIASEDQLRAAALARIKEIVLFDRATRGNKLTRPSRYEHLNRFLHYMVGSDADPAIVSQRVEGNDIYAVIAGSALFCLFSAARWSDAAKAGGLSIDSHGQADDQMTFMPLIALGHTFRDLPWEILHGDEFDEYTVAKVTTHALKATPLSWATKSGRFDKHEKRILGHHSSPDERMIVTYGRDVMCPVLAKLQHVIDLIRAGRFDPDRTRAERMSSMVMRLNEQAEIDVQPERRVEDLKRLEESEQSDVSLEDHEKLNEHPSLVPGFQGDPEPPETGSYVRHKVSLIVHIVMVPASLLRCGRPLNHNYEDCSYNPDQPREDILCEQCKSARASV
ncbi:hypothetical protein AK812_SmicGene37242 [Symbiodinium microadriaticum]|uniref:Uncharacterized protein n=1 Tax=Symbiodinium microadriaticum TaxID=2951 RepID=A0A1Q9CGT3_SYMMI|nr:hypothetical protein AK812_SmicGene37242 [Symbiodinium microadriaticum]